MFFPEAMARLVWVVPREQLASCLQQLAETESFQPNDQQSLGDVDDLHLLRQLRRTQQIDCRLHHVKQALKNLPEKTLLSYEIGVRSGSAPLPQGAIPIDNDLFLQVGRQLSSPEARRPPSPDTQAPALNDHQFELLFSTEQQIGYTRDWAIIDGWIPARRMPQFNEMLKHQTFALIPAEETELPLSQVPSLFHRHKILEGFGSLMKLYGITGYRELDPTPILAISFSLMFGLMFADLGQGLLLFLLGLWLFNRGAKDQKWQSYKLAGLLLMPIGVSAAFFGTLFGSLFAHEDWIPALIFHPMQQVVHFLILSIFVGISVLCLGMGIGILNAWLSGRFRKQLWDNFGPIGLLFYLASIGLSLGYWLQQTSIIYFSLALMGACLACIAIRHFLLLVDEPLGLRLMITVIETYDFAIKFIVQTLSFIRLAAFTFSHIALSMALLMIVELLSSNLLLASLAFVLGNILIALIEGILVCIQVTRLHFSNSLLNFHQEEVSLSGL
ncbi:V-type ATPase 116kDa subunit family protein [Dongshaea marina]|uniref:V-type ATPase 116kDa subunit family protein n=1 Tax=Dongshaea marina TaxID=2047966 RepID=UPI000D3E5315|nr:V-type ATPase 116kDa subunit family protein [Dongshaea marina]